ncbi:MAG: hypothetical protein AB7H71_02940 [Alphaproteobacteria bacterium]
MISITARVIIHGYEDSEADHFNEGNMDELIKPGDLHKVAAEKEMARAREIADAEKRRADERHHLQQAFMDRQLHPEVKTRVSNALRAAAERGETHLRVMTFSSELCTDGGRAINNGDPNWPKTLVGFAARAYEFYHKELQPHGYRLRAEILDFPGGMPGEVGITLTW